MSELLDGAREVDVDIDSAWLTTVAALRRRRRSRRAAAVGAGATATLMIVGLVLVTGNDGSRVGVTVEPTVPSTDVNGKSCAVAAIPTSAAAAGPRQSGAADCRAVALDRLGIPGQVANLREIDRGWERLSIDTRLLVSREAPIVVPAGDQRGVDVTVSNISDEEMELGIGTPSLYTFLTDAEGRIVGGSATGTEVSGPAHDYPRLARSASLEVSLVIGTMQNGSLGAKADPLPVGEYYLWIELPQLIALDGTVRQQLVAGPLAVTLAP